MRTRRTPPSLLLTPHAASGHSCEVSHINSEQKIREIKLQQLECFLLHPDNTFIIYVSKSAVTTAMLKAAEPFVLNIKDKWWQHCTPRRMFLRTFSPSTQTKLFTSTNNPIRLTSTMERGLSLISFSIPIKWILSFVCWRGQWGGSPANSWWTTHPPPTHTPPPVLAACTFICYCDITCPLKLATSAVIHVCEQRKDEQFFVSSSHTRAKTKKKQSSFAQHQGRSRLLATGRNKDARYFDPNPGPVCKMFMWTSPLPPFTPSLATSNLDSSLCGVAVSFGDLSYSQPNPPIIPRLHIRR